jgi:DNA-binding response OmpR family regulator
MKLLLAGEDTAFLRALSLDLIVRGFQVTVVTDGAALRRALEHWQPDVILLDHVEPMDLYILNPRESGYDGPLLLLVSDGLPESMVEQMQTASVVKKPLVLEVLSAEIKLVAKR